MGKRRNRPLTPTVTPTEMILGGIWWTKWTIDEASLAVTGPDALLAKGAGGKDAGGTGQTETAVAIFGYIGLAQVLPGEKPREDEIDESPRPSKQSTGNTENRHTTTVGEYGHSSRRNGDSVKGDFIRYAGHAFAG